MKLAAHTCTLPALALLAVSSLNLSSSAQGPNAPPVPHLAIPALNTLLVGVDRRSTTSLNGDWHYLVEQPPNGSLYGPGGKVRDNGYALNTHPNISTGPHNDEYDFATAPTLKVPGDWNTQVPALFRFEGVVWYQRDFTVQPAPNTRTFLHIGAANYMSHVWVNQMRICDHEGGFTPFDCEVTAALHAGSNFVVIAVDSTRHQDDIPSVTYDWFDYGGITRDVSLVTVPQAFIDDYDVHLAKDPTFAPASGHITGYVHVLDAPAGTSVSIKIPDAGIATTATTDASGKAAFDVPPPNSLSGLPNAPASTQSPSPPAPIPSQSRSASATFASTEPASCSTASPSSCRGPTPTPKLPSAPAAWTTTRMSPASSATCTT